jgi:hypothetical protein
MAHLPSSNRRQRYCASFVAPPAVDLSSEPSPALHALTAALADDPHWTLDRLGLGRPHSNGEQPFSIWVEAPASRDEHGTRQVIQGRINGVVTDVIPGARFGGITPKSH